MPEMTPKMTKRERKALRESIRKGILAAARTLLIPTNPSCHQDMWEDDDHEWQGEEVTEDTLVAYAFLQQALRNSDAWGAFWKGYGKA